MEKLIKQLRELQALTEHCDEQLCYECKNRELCDKYNNKTLNETYKEAADAIEQLSELALDEHNRAAVAKWGHRWIPVTERLPKNRYDVLVYAGVLFPYITVGYYDGLWKFSYNDEEIAGSADYWMPLPQPPQNE